jgi:hypothetical protein
MAADVDCILSGSLLAIHSLFYIKKEIKMKVTLRKANALQTAIQDHLKTVEVKNSISLNEFQDPETELVRARMTALANDSRRVYLSHALYEIRAAVGRANAESGVSDLLSQAAFNDKRLAQIKSFVEAEPTDSMDVIKGKLRKISEDKGDRRAFVYENNVTTSVLTEEQISAFRDEMQNRKKEKQKINDKILELNIRTEIELTSDIVKILSDEDLV